MKKLYFILLAISIGMPNIVAQQSGQYNDRNYTRLRDKVSNRRPNAPSRLFIDCIYYNNCIEFILPPSVEDISVSLIQGETVIWSGYASTDEPIVMIPFLSGEYTIECIDNEGRHYIGTMTNFQQS